jgi:hypothetical protein
MRNEWPYQDEKQKESDEKTNTPSIVADTVRVLVSFAMFV